MASSVPPVKNTALTTYVMLASQSQANTFQANPTLASGDVRICIDDGAPANLATLPVVDADFTKRVKVVLSAAEMNGDVITVLFSDASGAEWKDLALVIYTAAQTLDTVDANIDLVLEDTGTTIPAQITGLNDPTAAAIRAEMDSNSTQLAAIVADTSELQTDWADGGRLDLIVDAILADTAELQADDVPGLIAALENLTAAEVNAQVLDVLNTDIFAEPASVPPAAATLAQKIGWLYLLARNRLIQTNAAQTIYADDATTPVGTAVVADDGTQASRAEWS